MPHVIHITSHATERWVERIVDPARYEHLSKCKLAKCDTCATLIRDIRDTVRDCGRGMHSEIASRYLAAVRAERKITDISFLQAIGKKYGDLHNLVFYAIEKGILVVNIKSDDGIPILVTVLGHEMLAGTIFRTLRGDDLKQVFSRWKFEAKQQGPRRYFK